MASVQRECEGWPIGASIKCQVCRCGWTVDPGDQDRVEVDLEAQTFTVDMSCPGCTTRYTATQTIGAHGFPAWEMSESQYNLAKKVIDVEYEDAEEQLDVEVERERQIEEALAVAPKVTRPRTEKPKAGVEGEEAHDA